MNFLSHYYFERQNQDSNMVVGTILPDLVKNAQKEWNLFPQKNEALFLENQQLNSLLHGWKRHLEVDLIFHSSDFFMEQMAILKQLLLPILKDSPVRPSFLSHIGVELLLDHLLVTNTKVDIYKLYQHLEDVNDNNLNTFLNKCGYQETAQFFKFINNFKSSRYLFSYQKIENISYALQRICMRLWINPFTEETTKGLTEQLAIYKLILEKDYLNIYGEIEAKLNK